MNNNTTDSRMDDIDDVMGCINEFGLDGNGVALAVLQSNLSPEDVSELLRVLITSDVWEDGITGVEDLFDSNAK